MNNEDFDNYIQKLKILIDKLSIIKGRCLICMKYTYRRIVVCNENRPNNEDLLYTEETEKGIKLRYGITTVCEDHDLNDPETSRQLLISTNICSEMNRMMDMRGKTIEEVIKKVDDIQENS